MERAHVFRSTLMDWRPHPSLAGIRIKSLENSLSHPEASVTLVEVDAGGAIEPHTHEHNYETAYLLSGQAVLSLPEGEVILQLGDGVTVPPKTQHALRNSGSEPVRILAMHIPPMM